MSTPKTRLNLDLPKETSDQLENLAFLTKDSKTRIIRQAVSLYSALVSAELAGARVKLCFPGQPPETIRISYEPIRPTN